jgi:hypothetical protein
MSLNVEMEGREDIPSRNARKARYLSKTGNVYWVIPSAGTSWQLKRFHFFIVDASREHG